MTDESQQAPLPANLSTLILSIASQAAMALGLAPHPETQQIEKNLELAQFNIDLLLALKAKTVNNLTSEEQRFLDSILSDLQLKFVEMKK